MEKPRATHNIHQSLMPFVTRSQVLTEDMVRRVAAMLGLSDIEMSSGGAAPFGWHFPLLGAETYRHSLRGDGFPGLGIPFPSRSGKRLIAAGRTVDAHGTIQIGKAIERTSRIKSVKPKLTAQGEMTIVIVRHDLHDQDTNAQLVAEEQTYILLDTRYSPTLAEAQPTQLLGPVVHSVTPDENLLFQFSALSFNSHKIHLDRDYAREVEGYPDLVVNGGLTTLLMTEIARVTHRSNITRLKVRNTVPLFCNRAIRFTRHDSGGRRTIAALDHCGRMAAEMEYELNDV